MASIVDFLTGAKQAIGHPYVFGAQGPNSFDCSGLVQWALAKVGIHAPRESVDQEAWTTPVKNPQPGDLAFYGTNRSNGHVAIYLGNGMVLNAPEPGTNVRIQKIWTGDSSQPGPRFGRIPGLGGAVPAGTDAVSLGGTGAGFGDLTGALAGITQNLKNFSDFMASMLKAAAWIANPVNDLRILSAIWGTLIILGGLVLLAFAA